MLYTVRLHWLSLLLFVCSSVIPRSSEAQNRAPPGVNPQHYQGGGGGQHHPPPPPPGQGQFQGQPQQFQGQHQQFQGQPQQFQGQPQQFQGQPQQFQGQPQQFQGQPQQFQGQPQQFQGQPQQFQGGPPPPPPQQGQPRQIQGQQAPQVQSRGQPVQQHQNQKVLHRDVKKEREHMKEHMEVPIDTSNMSEQELQFHYFKMHDADGNNKLDGCELVKSLIHWHDQSNHDHNSGQPVPEAKIFKDEELVNMIDPILASDDKNRDGYIDYPEFVQAQQAAQAAQKV